MALHAQLYTNSASKNAEWDSFIEQAPQGTLFHTRRFLEYHPAERFTDHSLLFYTNSRLDAVLPAAEINSPEGKTLHSHPGSSYGGLCTVSRPSLDQCIEMINILSIHCKDAGFSRFVFRMPERIFFKEPTDQLEFAMLKNGFECAYTELSTAYLLAQPSVLSPEARLAALPQKTRNVISKGIRSGLSFRGLRENEIDQFYLILETSLQNHQAKPTHQLQEIHRLYRLCSGEILPFGVFLGEQMVAGFLVFKVSWQSLHIFYSAQDYNYSQYNPTCYGVYHLMCWAEANGYTRLNYGISTENKGNVINQGLFKFKESFGGVGTLRTFWEKRF